MQARVVPEARVLAHRLTLIRLRYLYSWLDVFWLLMLFVQGVGGLWINGIFFLWSSRLAGAKKWLDPLPVSRRSLVLAGILPLVLSLVAGYLSGIVLNPGKGVKWPDISETTTQGWPPSARQEWCGRINVTPPLEYWQRTKNGAPYTIESPWGEKFEPPVIEVLGARVYNPYAVGCQNTQRFFNWQFARAASAVYGRAITLDDFVHNRYSHARPGIRMQILNVAAILTGAMLSLLMLALNDWYRWKRLNSRFAWSVMAVLFLGCLTLVLWGGPFAIQDGLQWISWSLPDNIAVMAAICVLPSLPLYGLLDKLCREAELPPASGQTVTLFTRLQQ